jgi:NADH:ubiquinone oxidoreductase subunit 5 (subunit L)/multisubunit Na+/H+ antiporter MnhA subunit
MWIVWALSLAGVVFSGYFSYSELVKNSCAGGGCSLLAGLPTCVYGLAMFSTLFLVSTFALASEGGKRADEGPVRIINATKSAGSKSKVLKRAGTKGKR